MKILQFILASVGLVLFALALAITLAVNVPIDNEIKGWTVATLPSDYQATRGRWQFYHSLRTFASLAAFGCVLASAQLSSKAART